MPRIHVVPPEKTRAAHLPQACEGSAQTQVYVDPETFPLELHKFQLGASDALTIGPVGRGRIGYVWHGAVRAGGHDLPAGSSFIVESGQSLAVEGAGEGGEVLLFSASHDPLEPEEGGHVHLLPSARVPRNDALTDTGMRGGMHADAQCPTCNVWLHENTFPGVEPVSPDDLTVGVHSHSEDEIIFIVSGQIRLGRKLFPQGTAIAIPGGTLYSFTAGPDGMAFVNFRAGLPADIHFPGGQTMNEVEYWKSKLPHPEYLEAV
jgi:hypothetical protein